MAADGGRSVALTLFLLIGAKVAAACDNVTLISSQVDLLLAEYDRGVGEAAKMQVTAALDIQHASVDESISSVRMLASLHLKWKDKRLSWNSTSWGCDNVLVSSERLWLPDITVLDATTIEYTGMGSYMGLRARLTSDGQVSWVIRYDLTTPVTLDLKDWPSDQQKVVFKFGSRSYSADELDLTLSELENFVLYESAGWELVSIAPYKEMWRRVGKDQTVLNWVVTLRRRAAAHSLAVAAVLAAAILLLVGAAMLPPAHRPSLCATATLVASLWMISALVRMPGANAAPRVMSLLCVVSVCGACMAAGAALVLRVARCSSPPPHALRNLVTATSAFCKLIPPEGSSAEWSAWAAAAQLLDYVLLALLLFTLFIVMCFSF